MPGSRTAFATVMALLERRTGQEVAANRAWRIEAALKTVLREHDLCSIEQLVERLRSAASGPLADAVVDAMLNQETSFFRDAAVLDQVVEAVRAIHAENPDRKVRIWSAGCSMGQEPLSLAMLFAEAERTSGLPGPEILATDVSAGAIARARAGRYSQFEIQRGLPVRRMVAWFEHVDGDWIVQPDLAKRVQFRRHNLVGDVPPIGRFDVVLCRNVLLYFPAKVRAEVFRKLRTGMREGGLLVLGAGETVIGQTDAFRPSPQFRGFYAAEPASIVPITR
ncbi:MAG: protein-glutamate O-methyltransferase CheR [Sphingomonas sp.]|nr:protein-glutamate O-methyltransferase CheR [Sphingomonas sp.]